MKKTETQVKTRPGKPAKKKKTVKWIVITAVILAAVIAAVLLIPKLFGGSSASTVIGILFGSYPAAKASKLQPIEALHAE